MGVAVFGVSITLTYTRGINECRNKKIPQTFHSKKITGDFINHLLTYGAGKPPWGVGGKPSSRSGGKSVPGDAPPLGLLR